MSKDSKIGFSCVLALGLVACGSNTTDVPDGATTYYPPADAYVSTPDGPATVAPDPYVWVVIQDTEQKACSTNGPGSDIDAVELADANRVPLGYGLKNSAIYTANPQGNACENSDCKGGNCKYAANGTTFTEADLVSRTEGPPDAVVKAVGDDVGYFSLNAGTLQIQIGDTTGAGPAQPIKSGDLLQVYEVDQTYITSDNAPATCVCQPEHYTVTLQTAVNAAQPSTLQLTPIELADDNATTCAALALDSTEGCGTTWFVVP
jgi:hypothetical protein